MTLKDHQRAMKRGLVVTGGGAIGAYSFGCLKALKEADIRFDAVSATSAGALNAAIWATDSMPEGEALWSRMSPENTYDLKPWLKWLPVRLSRLIILILIAISMLAHRNQGRAVRNIRDPLNRHVEAALVAVDVACCVGGAIVGAVIGGPYWAAPTILGLMLGSVALTAAIAPLTAAPDLRHGALLNFLAGAQGLLLVMIIGFWGIPPLLALIDEFILHLFGGALPDIMEIAITSFLVVIAYALGFKAFLLFLLISSYLISSLIIGHSAFTSEPLRRTIEELVIGRAMPMPFFATIARSEGLFDPDKPVWEPTIFSQDDFQPLIHPCWVPNYARVDQLDEPARINLLLATAALPFGIVTPIRIDGEEYVDGGLADNTPVAPLLQYEFDEIWILNLDPICEPDAQIFDRSLLMLRRQSLAKFPHPEISVGHMPHFVRYDPPQIVPYPLLDKRPKIITIGPKERLGGIFDGLLNFSPAYAARMIALGQERAREILSVYAAVSS